MALIQRTARVPYSALQMLTLVNDIEAYPEFLHWCRGARIEKDTGPVVEAVLDIGITGVHKTMRTRNTTTVSDTGSPARIRIEMLDGPLKRMNGGWTFTDREPDGCDVELVLDYDVQRTPFGFVLRTLFDEIANSQLSAFFRRARSVYGAR